MLDIFEGNQEQLIHFVEIEQTEIDALIRKYEGREYKSHDNLATVLWEELISTLYKNIVLRKIDEQVFMKELSKPQKVIDVLENFHGQVNNGGIYQFFWNRKNDVLAVEQSLREIGYEEMLLNYQKVRVVFDENEKNINQLKVKDRLKVLIYNIQQFFLKAVGRENKELRRTGYEYFVAGYDLVKETEWFNEYFWEEGTEVLFSQKKADYILKNLSLIALVK